MATTPPVASMASSNEDVAQLLSTRTATPIAQLTPDLDDHAARKIHGEVTVTWPYNSLTKSFAFLLAEPDVRLRRNKGLVRIHLTGPSAEAVGHWELGSGDEVTLALDGVEWAKDEEPVRLAGSRSDWQLKFAGKLTLKAFLGEIQETKFVTIDLPVPIEAPEVVSPSRPIPFAEIDHTLFHEESFIENSPSPLASTPPQAGEVHPSPIFMKRSRASYGPMFDFEELEEDYGRSAKRRRGLHYAAVNGRWKIHVGDGSPSPEPEQASPVAAQEQSSDVIMQDGGVQTRESDLAPTPAGPTDSPNQTFSNPTSVALTEQFEKYDSDTQLKARELAQRFGTDKHPKHMFLFAKAIELKHGDVDAAYDYMAKTFPRAGSSMTSDTGASRSSENVSTNATVQAPRSSASVPAPAALPESAPAATASNAFGQGFKPAGISGFGQSDSVLKAPPIPPASATFGQAFGSSSFAGFGQPHGRSQNQGFGHSPSLFGQNPATTVPANAGFGQGSSLFGTTSTTPPSPFAQTTSANVGSGAPTGSVRFGFGQSSSPLATSAFGAPQSRPQPLTDPLPESSAISEKNRTPVALQNPSSTEPVYDPGLGRAVEPEAHIPEPEPHISKQEVALWPMGTQTFDSIHAVGHVHVTENLRSDDSIPEESSPGMIPPSVDDGTRNVDEMRREGNLLEAIFQQGVPQQALTNQQWVDEDGDSMDSEERADYNEAQMGNDYDLRNYDRVSDDEEGVEHDESPLSDEELLGQSSEHFVGPASGYTTPGWYRGDENGMEDEEDEYDDYDEDEDEDEGPNYAPQPRFAPQPPSQQGPIEVIDLISDSEDEDEDQVTRLKSANTSEREAVDLSKNESEVDYDEQELQVGQEVALHRSRQEATDLGDEDTGSEHVNGEFSEGNSDGDEDEADLGLKEFKVVVASSQPDYDMAEGSRDEGSGEDDAEKAATEVNSSQLVGAGGDAAMDDGRQDHYPDSEGALKGQEQEQDASQMDHEEPDGAVGHQQRYVALRGLTPEDQPGTQSDRIITGAQLDSPNDTHAVGGEPPSESEMSSQSEEPDDIVVNVPGHGVVADAMAVDGNVHDDQDGSFQSQPDDILASTESRLTASTSLSQMSQNHDAGDFNMKNDDAPVAIDRALAREGGERPGAGTALSSEIAAEDSMDIDAEETPVILRKTGTVEVCLDDEQDESESSPASQTHPQSLLHDQADAVALEKDTRDLETDLASQSSDEESIDQQRVAHGQHNVVPLENETAVLEADQMSQPLDAEWSDQQRVASEMQELKVDREVNHEATRVSSTIRGLKRPAERVTSPKDVDMVDPEINEVEHAAQEPASSQVENEVKSANETPELKSSEVMEEEVPEARGSPSPEDVGHDEMADEQQRPIPQTDEPVSDNDQGVPDAPAPTSSPSRSFASADSHLSDAQEGEKPEIPAESPKRVVRQTRTASGKLATATKKGQREASRPGYRQVSAQQVPSSQRRTRSKTMSFQAAGPDGDKEDMSIQAARAALKSPESKKRNVSTTKRLPTDLVKRLDKVMPGALSLKDIRKGLNPPAKKVHPDFAAVVTSVSTQLTRTPAREYTTVFTVTDPSVALGGVVEVEFFDNRKMHCPAVNIGDAVLLRNFMVKALRDRGFGLTSRSATGSSWAVFKAEGDDKPEMGVAVEMNAKEKKFMLDLRSWYADLSAANKGKLAAAATAMEEAGTEHRAKK